MEQQAEQAGYGRETYIWLSIALVAPVLLLPLRLTYGSSIPAFGVNIESHWMLLAGCLLLVVVTADSTLRLVQQYRTVGYVSAWPAYSAASWVFFVALAVPYIVGHPALAWYLAGLFLLHAWRSAVGLWREDDAWWLWYAWWRDALCASALFFWLAYWPAYA